MRAKLSGCHGTAVGWQSNWTMEAYTGDPKPDSTKDTWMHCHLILFNVVASENMQIIVEALHGMIYPKYRTVSISSLSAYQLSAVRIVLHFIALGTFELRYYRYCLWFCLTCTLVRMYAGTFADVESSFAQVYLTTGNGQKKAKAVAIYHRSSDNYPCL